MTQARLAVEAGILTQSARALKAIVGLIWGWLLVIPFPLRAALILAGLVLSLSWGLRGAVPSVTDGALRLSMAALVLLGTLLLIPAGEMSLWRRRHRNQPATWAYAYGESLESAVC
ncbi:MAG: hypothetical protein ACRDTT_07975, partial [Pseudonocardiaceae bacterium]